MRGMLNIYALQRRKIAASRAKQKLSQLNVIRQAMPVLHKVIESAGNFEMALDLIQNAEDMISNELHNAKVCEIYKQQLSDLKYRCTSSLEKECLNLIDKWIGSKIQFLPSS